VCGGGLLGDMVVGGEVVWSMVGGFWEGLKEKDDWT
jgi:hypothetical protein